MAAKKSLKPLKNRRGQGLVEYLIIVAIMAVGTMAIIRVLNSATQVKFAKVTQSIQGSDSKIEVNYETLEERHFKTRDMGNFFHGSNGKDK